MIRDLDNLYEILNLNFIVINVLKRENLSSIFEGNIS